MKRIFICAVLSCYVLLSHGLNFTVNNITYTTLEEAGTVEVNTFSFSLIDVVIPSSVTYKGVEYQVKAIGEGGLCGTKMVTPYSSNYAKMKTLVISEGIEIIKKGGIAANKYLTTVSLPSTLTELGEAAFNNSTALTTITFPNGNNILAIGAQAFKECNKLASFEIPSGVISIGEEAFYNCTKLASPITIPENITVIQPSTFYGCTALSTVNLHNQITRIEQSAFHGCSALEDIALPKSLEYIGKHAFSGVAFKHLILHGNLGTIPWGAFSDCTKLEYVWVQEGITEIGRYAFQDCRKLAYIVLPSTLQLVEKAAFSEGNELLLDYEVNHVARSFFFLADTPFEVLSDYSETGGFYNYSLGRTVEGDHFYVKESAVETYRNKWKTRATYKIEYKIPFDASRTYSTKYCEFDTDFHVAAESGNKPFVATGFNNFVVGFRSIDNNIVPAQTAVMIRRQSGTDTWFQIAESQGTAELDMTNYLKGITYADVINPTEENGDVNYVLNNGIFCSFQNSGTLGDHKAYLSLPTSAHIKQINMDFDEEEATGVETFSFQETENPTYYNLQGMRVNQPEKGIYIVNHKKVIIK